MGERVLAEARRISLKLENKFNLFANTFQL